VKKIVLRLLPLCLAFSLAACEDDLASCELDLCSGQCTDVQIDRFNCGQCGNVCSAGFECVEGACTECPEGNCIDGDLYAACFQAGEVVELERETLEVLEGRAGGVDGPQSLAIFGEYLLVLGGMDQTLHVYDRASLVRVGSEALGVAPNQVVVRGARAYGIVSFENTVQVIDLTDPTAPSTIDQVSLGEGKNPFAGAFDDRGTLWVTAWESGELFPVDFSGESGVVGEAIAIATEGLEGTPYPSGVVVIGDVVYASLNNLGPDFSPAGNGRLVAVDRTTREQELIDLGAGCRNPGFVAARGGSIHVACTGAYGADEGAVVVYDTEAGEVTRWVETGGAPSRLVLDPGGNGTVYVADAAGRDLIVVGADDEVRRVEVCSADEMEFVADVAVAP